MAHRRLLLLVVVSSLGACQCFVPVAEDGGTDDAGSTSDAGATPDGGSLADAGSTPDAGADAGPMAACRTHLDCPAPGPLPFCGPARPACVNGRCLVECGAPDAGRTCTHAAGQDCLTCDGQRECAQCRAFRCEFFPQPQGGSCPPPFDDFLGFQVLPFSGRCGAGITRDGGLEGVWYGTLTQGMLIEIPALGGTCLASPLFTQLPRAVISCPACTFVAEGCD